MQYNTVFLVRFHQLSCTEIEKMLHFQQFKIKKAKKYKKRVENR